MRRPPCPFPGQGAGGVADRVARLREPVATMSGTGSSPPWVQVATPAITTRWRPPQASRAVAAGAGVEAVAIANALVTIATSAAQRRICFLIPEVSARRPRSLSKAGCQRPRRLGP